MADTPGCLDNIPKVGGLLFTEGVTLGKLPPGKGAGEVSNMQPLTRHSSQGTLGRCLNFAIDPLLLPFI